MKITRPLAIVAMALRGGEYEAQFDDAMIAALPEVDTVWDIGANRGLYTTKFAQALRGRGTVIAFEPSPRSLAFLEAAFCDDPDITLCPVALSDKSGKSYFRFGEDEEGTTDALTDTDTGIEVEIATIDQLLAEGRVPAPDMIKMDVEGFEMDVTRGMEVLLSRRPPLHVFIEVHFAKLDARGQHNAPAEIEQTLKAAGYDVAWVDNSHIHARRRD